MTQRRSSRNTLRIIAGIWRGRKLEFPTIPDLRPTPDRIRETLFNWLRDDIAGARCLDLFAGSGALGFEALSRGAAKVVFVDSHWEAVSLIKGNIDLLHADGAHSVYSDAARYLDTTAQPFDIVFLDPPFRGDHLVAICHTIEHGNWLAPQAYIYIESPVQQQGPEIPDSWEIVRTKEAGQVRYQLAARK